MEGKTKDPQKKHPTIKQLQSGSWKLIDRLENGVESLDAVLKDAKQMLEQVKELNN